MTERRGPSSELLVVERAGQAAVGACGHLLAALGARTVRVETAGDTAHAEEAASASRRLLRGGKEIATLAQAQIAELLAQQVVVTSTAESHS